MKQRLCIASLVLTAVTLSVLVTSPCTLTKCVDFREPSPASSKVGPLKENTATLFADSPAPPATASVDTGRPRGGSTAESSKPCTEADQSQLGKILYDPSEVHFQQVLAPTGPVPIEDIEVAMASVQRALQADTRLVLFALDGTLLNLLRWGRIINDNDVDLGFYFAGPDGRPLGAPSGSLRPSTKEAIMKQYELLYETLGVAGITMKPDEKALKRIHHRQKNVKPGTCKHRGQMMQCRHQNGVIYDLFGPETIFSSLTHLSPDDLAPTRPCRSFSTEFPCPKRSLRVLHNFTIDIGPDSSGNRSPRPHFEFRGCALFPRRASEQSPKHLKSILGTVSLLDRCGYPSLHPYVDMDECKPILAKL